MSDGPFLLPDVHSTNAELFVIICFCILLVKVVAVYFIKQYGCLGRKTSRT